MGKMRSIFTFYAKGFNTEQTKEHYTNPENFGDDVAVWIAQEIEKHGAIIQKEREFPGQEDFGWYFKFRYNNTLYCLIIGARPDENGSREWVGWLEKDCGLIGKTFGERRKVGIEVYELLYKTLSESDKINNLRWHIKEDFDRGIEETASSSLD